MTREELLEVIEKAEKEQATVLSLIGKEITGLPPEIGRLKNLRELYLGDNKLSELPKEIGQLSNLFQLGLTNNQLRELPKEIYPLSNLYGLALNLNKIRELPKEIGQLSNLYRLNLESNQLNRLPKEIGQLSNLFELVLRRNQLKELPKEIYQLSNLFELDLRRNQLSELPKEICYLSNLSKLALSGNQLSELPKEILQLSNLSELSLSENQLRELPKEIIYLKNLEKLHVFGNPLKHPPIEIVQQGVKSIFKYLCEFHGEKYEEIITIQEVIKMRPELRTSFKQYLAFFNDFVEKAKGQTVNLEVHSHEQGLELLLKTDSETNIDVINSYLSEYIGFTKQNIENLDVLIETEIKPVNTELFILELKNQIRNLKSSLEVKVLENKMLERDVNRLYHLLEINLKNPQPITFQSNQTTDISLHIDIKNELPAIQSDFDTLRELITASDPKFTHELKELGNNLDKVSADNNKEELKSPLNKLGRFLTKLGDEKSEYHQIIAGTKRGIELAQKLGKTYNRFAQWLALPQVPNVFLGK